MEYSIITTCDRGYFPFLKILIDSVTEVCDVSKINNFIVVDTGLTPEQREYLTNKLETVVFIETDLQTNFNGGIWGEDWRKNVKSKTVTLYDTLLNIDHPLLMLDADMKVLRDLKELINIGGDLQVCHRKNHNIAYIGSYFFIINPTRCREFVKYWRDLTNKAIGNKAMESPSLVKAVKEFKDSLEIKELPETLVNVISSELLKEDSFLIHYKSKALHKNLEDTLKYRIWNTK